MIRAIRFALYLALFSSGLIQAQEHDWLLGTWSGPIGNWAAADVNRYLRIQSVASDGAASGSWSTTPTSAGKAVIKVQGSEVTVVTSAKSTVTLKRDGDRLVGSFTLQNGRAYPIALAKGTAPAAEKRTVLSKSEVAELAIGKVFTLRRLSDDHVIIWDIRKDGYLYANNRNSNGSDSASWVQDEAGGICLTWRGNSNSGCVYLARQGTNYTFGNRSGSATMAVTEIK